jgi:hypothetical protein
VNRIAIYAYSRATARSFLNEHKEDDTKFAIGILYEMLGPSGVVNDVTFLQKQNLIVSMQFATAFYDVTDLVMRLVQTMGLSGEPLALQNGGCSDLNPREFTFLH